MTIRNIKLKARSSQGKALSAARKSAPQPFFQVREGIFINPEHVVSVSYDPADSVIEFIFRKDADDPRLRCWYVSPELAARILRQIGATA